MIHDSITLNPREAVIDSPSFFKGFVQLQDETSVLKGLGPFKNSRQLTVDTGIIQMAPGDSGMICTSVFAGHQLTPKSDQPQMLPLRDPGWVLGILILVLLLLVFVKISYPRRLNQILRAFISPRGLNVLIKEGNILRERINPPLVMVALLTFSLFFYQLVLSTKGLPAFIPESYLLYLLLFGVISLFYGYRWLVVRLIGWVFRTTEQSRAYVINAGIIYQVWAMALLPLCVSFFYLKGPLANYILFASGVLFMLLLLYLLVRSFLIGLGVTKFSRFYLFLYLCTVEILPLIVLGKIASGVLK